MISSAKEIFESIKENNFDFSSYDKHHIASLLLSFIGDKDPYMRDELVYDILSKLFMNQQFSEHELVSYLNRLMSHQFLLYDLENQEESSILKRSFTILQLVVFVYIHRRDQVIDQTIIKEMLITFKQYILNEKIRIGYDRDLGWIHAVAHGADLLGQLSLVPSFGKSEMIDIFDTIANLVMYQDMYYQFNEDERLASAIKKGLSRDILTESDILRWINQFLIKPNLKKLPEKIYYRNNIRSFLSTLYVMYIGDIRYVFLTKQILDILVKNQNVA